MQTDFLDQSNAEGRSARTEDNGGSLSMAIVPQLASASGKRGYPPILAGEIAAVRH
jgi:hypothetical protein